MTLRRSDESLIQCLLLPRSFNPPLGVIRGYREVESNGEKVFNSVTLEDVKWVSKKPVNL